MQEHASKLTPASTKVYTQFLDRLFDTGTGLMLTPGVAEKSDLGRHCFSYCNLLAGEFYFQQAADCRCRRGGDDARVRQCARRTIRRDAI